MYRGSSSRVEVNGYISAPFAIARSVRQGGPESMNLFTIAIMPLVAQLALRLSGSRVRELAFKVSNYVDDTQFLLRSRDEVPTVVDALGAFTAASGLPVNYGKTKALSLGSWEGSDLGIPVTFVATTRILGVQFSARVADLPALNWPNITAKAAAVLWENSGRGLCLEQRVRFVNTFALSKLWYVAKVVPPQRKAVQALRMHIGNFVWRGRFFRVPYPILCSSIGEGGFGLHDPVVRCQALFYSKWHSQHEDTPETFSADYLAYLYAVYHEHGKLFTPRVLKLSPHFKEFAVISADIGPHCDVTGRALIKLAYESLLPQRLPRRVRVEELLPNTNWPLVWSNVQSRVLTLAARSSWFEVVHDLLPTNSRLHRINRSATDRCAHCGRWDTALHRVSTCGEAAVIWRWLHDKLAHINAVPPQGLAQDFLVRPDVQLSSHKPTHNTAIWLVGHTVMAVLSAPRAPSLPDVVDFTLKPLHAAILKRSARYIKRKYGKHLPTLLE
jgi:hypothetical protein